MPRKQRIKYEWISLQLDEYGDIENMDHHTSFVESVESSIAFNNESDDTDLKDGTIELRKYYMDDGDIEEDTFVAWDEQTLSMVGRETNIFSDGSTVPQRYLHVFCPYVHALKLYQ